MKSALAERRVNDAVRLLQLEKDLLQGRRLFARRSGRGGGLLLCLLRGETLVELGRAQLLRETQIARAVIRRREVFRNRAHERVVVNRASARIARRRDRRGRDLRAGGGKRGRLRERA